MVFLPQSFQLAGFIAKVARGKNQFLYNVLIKRNKLCKIIEFTNLFAISAIEAVQSPLFRKIHYKAINWKTNSAIFQIETKKCQIWLQQYSWLAFICYYNNYYWKLPRYVSRIYRIITGCLYGWTLDTTTFLWTVKPRDTFDNIRNQRLFVLKMRQQCFSEL